MTKRLLIYNDDGWSSYMRYPAPMSPEDVVAVTVGPVIGTAVTHYQFCALGGHVVNYNSAFLPRIGEMMDEVKTLHVWRMRETLRALERLGTDPLRIVSAACWQHGIKLQFSLRMNDAHHTYRLPDGAWYFPELQSPWFEQHRDSLLPSGQLDYAHPDVHDYRIAQITEILDRYDVDGIDLDFTRFKPWFAQGMEAAGMPRMTALLSDWRDLTRARDKTLSARFEYDPAMCIASGLDVERWLADGLLDQVTLGGVAAATPDAPATWWIERAHRSGCVVCPSMEGQLDWLPGPGWGGLGTHAGNGVHDGFGPPSIEYMRAVSARHYRDGADGISLFNFTCADGPFSRLAFTELADPAALAHKDKQYVATLWQWDSFPCAEPWHSVFVLKPDEASAAYTLAMTDELADLNHWALPTVVLTLDLMGVNRLSDMEVLFNDTLLVWTGYRYNHYDHGCWNDVVQFTVPAHCLLAGDNRITLRRRAATPGFAGDIEVRKCILDVRYPEGYAPGG